MRKAGFLYIFTLILLSFEVAAQESAVDAAKNVAEDLKKVNENPGDITKTLGELVKKRKKRAKSLMFSDEEIDNLKRAVNSYESGEALEIDDGVANNNDDEDLENAKKREQELVELNERSKIHLGSIMYFNKKKWAIWLNKTKITAQNNDKNNEFFVKRISRDKAYILWSLSLSKWRILSGATPEDAKIKVNDKNQVMINFVLRPNQSFLLRHSRIIEGHDVSLVSKEEGAKEAPLPEEKNVK